MVKNGLVIFVSGRGSNLEAIISASKSSFIPSKVSAVIADRNCKGIDIAKKKARVLWVLVKPEVKEQIGRW